MFDIGWPELFVIAVVALVVIGPKDLPRVLHTVGKWVRKARSLARDFQSSVDDMVRESELEDLRKQMQQARGLNLKDQIEKSIDPKGEMRDSLTFGDLDVVDEGEEEDGARPAAPAATQPAPAKPTLVENKPVADLPMAGPAAQPVAAAPPAAPADVPAAEKRG